MMLLPVVLPGAHWIAEIIVDAIVLSVAIAPFLQWLVIAPLRKAAVAEKMWASTAMEATTNSIMITDRDGTILWVNPVFTETTGYSAEEAIGQTPRILKSGKHEMSFYQRLWNTILVGRVWREVIINRRKDGSLYTSEQTITPVSDEDGGIAYFICIEQDISEQEAARGNLHLRTGQLQAITDATNAFLETGGWHEASAGILHAAMGQTASEYGFLGVVVEGPELRILAHEGITWDAHENREFYEQTLRAYREKGYLEFTNFDNLFGRVITSAEPILSNDPSTDPRAEGLPPGHPPLRHFLGVPMLRGQEVVGMIAVANRPGGYATAEQDNLKVLTQTASVLFDSYRRQERELSLEEELRQSQKMQAVGRLAGGVAHDFNNLLTIIMGQCALLQIGLHDDEPNKGRVEEISAAGKRAARLTSQLLAFSRRQVLEPKVLDLNAVIINMLPMLRRLIGEDIELLTSMNPNPGAVKTDPGQMEQVVMNLAVNARDAMPEGGKLIIETMNVDLDEVYARRHIAVRPGPYVVLAVTDSGCGMSAETEARLFDPFFTTKEVGKGTGLGLSMTYGIVKQSGGNIWVYSEPGRGTTFKIYLPRLEGATVTDEPAARRPLTPRGSEVVLLVEDADGVRSLARELIEAQGYTVLEARDGVEALQVCARHDEDIDLMLTDVVMPRMSGPELAERMASLRPGIKVVYMSGYTGDAIAHHGVLDVGVPFVQKPFTSDDLANTIRGVLDAPGLGKR